MTSVAIVGCTGLVGSNILDGLLKHPSFSNVSAFTRKQLSPDDPHSRLRPIIDSDSSNWAADFSSISPAPAAFLSALGTTRALAGGFENQRKIDLDLNLDLAKAAKEAGARVYVLISSAGVSKNSMLPYSKMKGELDEAVQELGFEKVVLVKPGLIVGKRQDSRPPETVFRMLAQCMGSISGGRLKDFWAQDAEVIGRAAVAAAAKALDGTAPEGKTWVVNMNDVIRLGRTEWKD